MYTWIKIKNEVFGKSVPILLFLSFLFVFSLNIFEKSMETGVNFKIDIVDEDKTDLSGKTAGSILEIEGVTSATTEEDVEYIIKKGFKENFKKGRLKGLVEVRKKSFKSGVSLLNDRIATKLIRDYIYLNLYDRINTEKKISFEEYQNSLGKTQLENEILAISVNDMKIEDNPAAGINYSSYIILFFLLSAGLNTGVNQTVKLHRIRKNGIMARLKLSGADEPGIVLTEAFVAVMKYMALMLPAVILRNDIKACIIAGIIFLLNLIFNFIVEKMSKEEGLLVFILRSMMTLFLAAALAINFYF